MIDAFKRSLKQESTINKIIELQNLIKSESSTKELCELYNILIIYYYNIVIKTRDDILKQVEEECENLYTERVKILNLHDNANLPEKAKKIYNFIPIKSSYKYFQSNYYSQLQKFWKYLRETPDLIYEILKNSIQDYLTSPFNNFIINDLFGDIFHPDNHSDTLYYIIEKLFESEINKLEKVSDFKKIMTNSNIGFILGGFLLKEDILSYFSLILTEIIEGYENSEESSKLIILNIKDIENRIIKEEEIFNKELKRSNSELERNEIIKRKEKENYLFNQLYKMSLPKENNNINFCSNLTLTRNEEIITKNKKENEIFIKKYIPDLNKQELLELIAKEKNNYVKAYLQKKLKYYDKDINIFNNVKLLEKIRKSKKSEKILFLYQKNFIIIINILNKVIDKLISTLDAIPNSIKIISNIIYDLLIKKFKNADIIDICDQIAYFFFMKFFKYVFLSPDYYPLINNVILSETTKQNLYKIFEIFSQLISGEFFSSNEEFSDYTPFNWYFIENINKIYYLCQNIIITQINDYKNIQKTDNKTSNIDDFYSYSICFNMEIFDTILNIINEKKKIIFQNDKYSEFKLLVEDLIKNEENNIKMDNEKVNYYLYFEIIFTGDYLKIKNTSLTNKNFKITEDKTLNTNSPQKKSKGKEKDKTKNANLIMAKNLLSDILISIDDNDINEINHKVKNNTTKEIFETMKNYYIEKSYGLRNIDNKLNFFFNKKNVNIEWYINSLLICLDKLNDSYTKNDYSNLYSSLMKDLNNSIKNYKFKLLAKIIEKLKYTKYFIKHFKSCQKKYIELIINSKLKYVIEKENINIVVKLKYSNKEKCLIIHIPSKDELSKYSKYLCKNISEFIEKFPNLSKIEKAQELELFEVENKINLKGALNDFMYNLKFKIHGFFKENEKEIAYKKIKKYILTKIYEKIYPQESDNDDLLFYCKAISLSWIEPKHLKISYDINVDNFLPITNDYFEQIDSEKSPSCKMDVIAKIFDTINSALKFSHGGNFSTDDIAPIFEYALIKAKPKRLSSNLRYLEIFISKGSELKNMYFDFLKNNTNSLKEISHTQFDGITEEEFQQKCYESNMSFFNK